MFTFAFNKIDTDRSLPRLERTANRRPAYSVGPGWLKAEFLPVAISDIPRDALSSRFEFRWSRRSSF